MQNTGVTSPLSEKEPTHCTKTLYFAEDAGEVLLGLLGIEKGLVYVWKIIVRYSKAKYTK